MKTIVISAINFRDGGPLSILKDCIRYLSEHEYSNFKIVVLVHKKELLAEFQNLQIFEFPKSTKSYLHRLYYEYFHFKHLSNTLAPYLWLSLHDITPNVSATIRAVYCHNPSPFYKLTFKEFLNEPKLGLFNVLYKYVYAINIKKNNYVIVQQNWLRNTFTKNYNLSNVIVAHPETIVIEETPLSKTTLPIQENLFCFFFPTLPRIFKNIEVICEACACLIKRNVTNFEVIVTVCGSETPYAKKIYKKYSNIPNIKFVGRITRGSVFDVYKQMDCLLFPSKLETWGLPISECKHFGKPMIVADLEYAHETVGDYDKVAFFPPNRPDILADMMESSIKGREVFGVHRLSIPEQPFSTSWEVLFDTLLGNEYIKE